MVKLHPVAYESGHGVTLTDVDGNRYLDFSSGIVITNIGHAHPRVAEAIGRAAAELDNVHDFATPQKVRALEALDEVTPPGMSLFTFFSSGTEAIEAAMRVARAITGRFGFVSFHNDYHGRTGGAASVTAARSSNALRDAGSYLRAERARLSLHVLRRQLRPALCDVRRRLGGTEPARAARRRGDRADDQRQRGHDLPRRLRRRGRPAGARRRRRGHRRRGGHRLRPHRQLVRQRPRGRRPRRDGARQGDGQRLPGDRDRRARRARRGARRLVPQHQLRRQPDGLRGRVRGARRDAGGGPRRPLRRARPRAPSRR